MSVDKQVIHCHIREMDVAPIGKVIPQHKKKPRRRGPRLTGVSKQRRVANARERRRVEILNMNIQILRHMIPLPPQEKEPSKTEVIWLAVDYITELTKMLDSADQWQAELEMFDIDSLDSLDDSPLFNLEGWCYRLKEMGGNESCRLLGFRVCMQISWNGIILLSKPVTF